jgi:hypothetical protein
MESTGRLIGVDMRKILIALVSNPIKNNNNEGIFMNVETAQARLRGVSDVLNRKGNPMKLSSELDEREAVEHIEIAIQTPKGTWPTEGFLQVPADQKLYLQLDHVVRAMKLDDSRNWVAMSGNRKLDPNMSYRANNLQNRTLIHYIPA